MLAARGGLCLFPVHFSLRHRRVLLLLVVAH